MPQSIANQVDTNNKALVPLAKAKKILYMTHLALGDYVYQGAFIKHLCDLYPQMQFDIWIDDCRNKKKEWHQGRNSALQQWLTQEPHINHIYPIANNAAQQGELIREAQNQDYDFVVYLATTRITAYLEVAKQITAASKIIGTKKNSFLHRLCRSHQYNSLKGTVALEQIKQQQHISDFYNVAFKQMFNVSLPTNNRLRTINLSQASLNKAQQQIAHWSEPHQRDNVQVIFINHLSTNAKRDWRLEQVESLILALAVMQPNSLFIINSPPHSLQRIKQWSNDNPAFNQVAVKAFSATEDFFDLPALMAQCQLVISVETAIMHLASSLKIPQVALIREAATLWQPLNADKVLLGKKRVAAITIKDVITAAKATLSL